MVLYCDDIVDKINIISTHDTPLVIILLESAMLPFYIGNIGINSITLPLLNGAGGASPNFCSAIDSANFMDLCCFKRWSWPSLCRRKREKERQFQRKHCKITDLTIEEKKYSSTN
jgi:hypothetical protein